MPEIEKIIKKRVQKGKVEYLVKWKKMKNPSYQTWQALANLGYKGLMEEYERRNHPNQKGDSGASNNAKVYPTPVKIVNANKKSEAEVEKFLDHRVRYDEIKDQNDTEYLVKWKGLDRPEDCTWENPINLFLDCRRKKELLNEYSKNYPVKSEGGPAKETDVNMDNVLKESRKLLKDLNFYEDRIRDLEIIVEGGFNELRYTAMVCGLAKMIEERLGTLKSFEIAPGMPATIYQYMFGDHGINLMLETDLLPSLGCPHTVLTQGPVKERLVTKEARLLLVHFLLTKLKALMCKCCCDAVQASKKVTDNIELNDALRKMSTEEQEFYFRGKEKEKLTLDEVEKLKMKKPAAGPYCGSKSKGQSNTGKAKAADGAAATWGADYRKCQNCSATKNLLKCSGCGRAWYCNESCQRADRGRHKKVCGMSRAQGGDKKPEVD